MQASNLLYQHGSFHSLLSLASAATALESPAREIEAQGTCQGDLLPSELELASAERGNNLVQIVLDMALYKRSY